MVLFVFVSIRARVCPCQRVLFMPTLARTHQLKRKNTSAKNTWTLRLVGIRTLFEFDCFSLAWALHQFCCWFRCYTQHSISCPVSVNELYCRWFFGVLRDFVLVCQEKLGWRSLYNSIPFFSIYNYYWKSHRCDFIPLNFENRLKNLLQRKSINKYPTKTDKNNQSQFELIKVY